jgi:hypothetical protein
MFCLSPKKYTEIPFLALILDYISLFEIWANGSATRPCLGSETASTASKSMKQRGSMRCEQRTCMHHKQHFVSGKGPTSSAAAMRSWRDCLGLLVTLPTCDWFCSTFRIDLNSKGTAVTELSCSFDARRQSSW